MKVINTWDAPEETTMNSRCADCNCEDCRCDRIPMPAAGPWRYDVENAPNGHCLAWYGEEKIHHRYKVGDQWMTTDFKWSAADPIAFATINPPETTP